MIKSILKNKIINGDSLKELKKIPNETFDLIFADPPYNLQLKKELSRPDSSKVKAVDDKWDKFKNFKSYDEFTLNWLSECKRILMNNGTMFIFGYSEIIPYLTVYLQDELDMSVRALIWHYTNRTVPSLKFWQRSHDTILCCWKKKHKPHFNRDNVRVPYTSAYLRNSAGKKRTTTKGRFGIKETTYNAHKKGALPRDVIKFPCLAGGSGKNERVDHPTQKPLKVCTYLLKSCQQKEGDLVVPFSGSGTECVAAKCLKINYIGFEINKDYLKIANDRLLALEPNVEAVEETE